VLLPEMSENKDMKVLALNLDVQKLFDVMLFSVILLFMASGNTTSDRCIKTLLLNSIEKSGLW
jgi:hypothetical protein